MANVCSFVEPKAGFRVFLFEVVFNYYAGFGVLLLAVSVVGFMSKEGFIMKGNLSLEILLVIHQKQQSARPVRKQKSVVSVFFRCEKRKKGSQRVFLIFFGTKSEKQ